MHKKSETMFTCPVCKGPHFNVGQNGSMICASVSEQTAFKVVQGGCGWKGITPTSKDTSVLQKLNAELSLKLGFAEMLAEDVRDKIREMPAEIYADIQTLLVHADAKTPRFAIKVTSDGKIEYKIIIDEVQDIQASLDGGYFELIEETKEWFVYVDEDGKSKGLDKNKKGSLLLDDKTIQKKLGLQYPVGPILFVFKNSFDKQNS